MYTTATDESIETNRLYSNFLAGRDKVVLISRRHALFFVSEDYEGWVGSEGGCAHRYGGWPLYPEIDLIDSQLTTDSLTDLSFTQEEEFSVSIDMDGTSYTGLTESDIEAWL